MLAWSAWLGWFGGALFTDVPASAAARRPVTAIILSGDLGFRIGMGPKIAARLAAGGISVIGVNSLSFFNRRRSAPETAGLIEAAMARAATRYGAGPIVLIGQSFGADMLHFGLSALPPGERSRIVLVALVVPGERIQFQASPSDLFTFASAQTSGVPSAKRLDWAPLLCVQGMEETESLCPRLHAPNVTRVALPGGHLLRRDNERVAQLLAAAISAASAAPRSTAALRLAASIVYPEKGS